MSHLKHGKKGAVSKDGSLRRRGAERGGHVEKRLGKFVTGGSEVMPVGETVNDRIIIRRDGM